MYSPSNICGAIIFIVLTIVGFFGNSITAIVLLRDRTLRQHSTTAFILSLCISDLLCSAITIPVLAAAFLNEDLMNGLVPCKVFGATFYANFGITTFSIEAIAINRYILVVHNHIYKRFYQRSVVLIQLAITWFVPITMVTFPLLDRWGTIEKYKVFCRITKKDGDSIEDFLYLVGIFIPCLLVTSLYARIYVKVRQQSKNLSQHIPCGSLFAKALAKTKERERHLTLMTFLIFISFLVCCLPAVIEHFWLLGSQSPWPNVVTVSFCCLICVVNPFIYAATNRKYRAAYAKLFSDLKVWSFPKKVVNVETSNE